MNESATNPGSAAVDSPVVDAGGVVGCVSTDSPDFSLRGPSAFPTPVPTSPDSPSAENTPGVQRAKLKRNRLILSCQPCHKRKQQCDRGHPCRRCVKRGTTDECSYEQPNELGKRKHRAEGTGEPSDEQSSNGYTDALLASPNPQDRLPGVDVILGTVPLDSAPEHTVPVFSSGPNPSSPPNSAVELAAAALGQLAQQSSSPTFHQPVFPPPPATEYTNLFGNPPGVGIDICNSMIQRYLEYFPNTRVSQALLNHYFDQSSFHWMWPIIHRPQFESLFRMYQETEGSPDADIIAVFSMVLATSLQFLPETHENAAIFSDYPAGRHALQDRMFVFADSHLHKWTDFPRPSIQRVQAYMLMVFYEWNRGNIALSQYNLGLAIRTAQSLSLNYDGMKHSGLSARDAELGRRLWWLLFVMDRWHCLIFNQPYMIHEQHVSAALPMNLDQDDVIDGADLATKQHDIATDTLFHIHHVRFYQLGGCLWDKCFSGIVTPTYRAILDFEAEIRQFELDIPAALRYQTTQEERARPYLSFQNTMMSLELYMARIQLLAPFLFVHPTPPHELVCLNDQDRKLSDFHRHAKAVCLLFMKRQLALLQMFQSSSKGEFMTWPRLTVIAYTVAVILVVAIIIQPDHPENDELDEWITMAEDLIKVIRPRNALAPAALERLEIVYRRSVMVRCISRPPRAETQSCRMPSADVTMSIIQRMERAVKILAQPVTSMADRLGYDAASDPFWRTVYPPMYATRFPGIESLSQSVDDLDRFFDNCTAIHSRVPITVNTGTMGLGV